MKEIIEKNIYIGDLLLYPCPTVLVTSKYGDIKNVLTISWAGIASSHPEYITIAINTKRYSHSIICKSKRFCINIPNKDLINEVDYCGSVSGRDVDKYKKCNFEFETYKSDFIIINRCVFHLICEVVSIHELGSHDLLIAKVTNKLQSINSTLDPIIFIRPNYYCKSGEILGYYGFTMN